MAIFARIGTIKGESKDARHQDEIDVLSWTWGVSNTGGGGAGAGKATFHDLVLTHRIDKATPLLLKACATGQHLKDATLTVRKAGSGQHEYLVITLSDVLVASVSLSVTEEGDETNEAVVLTFAKVELSYKPQKPDGSLGTAVKFTHDLKTGKTT